MVIVINTNLTDVTNGFSYIVIKYIHIYMFLFLIGFVRFIRFNRLYTKPYPNPTVFIKLYPFGLYGIYQNQTILSISVRFGTVRFYHIEQPYYFVTKT